MAMISRAMVLGLGAVLGISFAIGKAIAIGCSIYVVLVLLGIAFAVVVATVR